MGNVPFIFLWSIIILIKEWWFQQADVNKHALALLDLSKRFFLEDGELDPVEFIITPYEQLLSTAWAAK